MSAAPALRTLPPSAPGIIVANDPTLTIETVGEGELLDTANEALVKAMQEAVKHHAKASVTLKVTIGPGGKDMADSMKVTGSVSLSLPKIESAKIVTPTADGRITTDLHAVRKVLRRVKEGVFEDAKTHEVTDANGVPVQG